MGETWAPTDHQKPWPGLEMAPWGEPRESLRAVSRWEREVISVADVKISDSDWDSDHVGSDGRMSDDPDEHDGV